MTKYGGGNDPEERSENGRRRDPCTSYLTCGVGVHERSGTIDNLRGLDLENVSNVPRSDLRKDRHIGFAEL